MSKAVKLPERNKRRLMARRLLAKIQRMTKCYPFLRTTPKNKLTNKKHIHIAYKYMECIERRAHLLIELDELNTKKGAYNV